MTEQEKLDFLQGRLDAFRAEIATLRSKLEETEADLDRETKWRVRMDNVALGLTRERDDLAAALTQARAEAEKWKRDFAHMEDVHRRLKETFSANRADEIAAREKAEAALRDLREACRGLACRTDEPMTQTTFYGLQEIKKAIVRVDAYFTTTQKGSTES